MLACRHAGIQVLELRGRKGGAETYWGGWIVAEEEEEGGEREGLRRRTQHVPKRFFGGYSVTWCGGNLAVKGEGKVCVGGGGRGEVEEGGRWFVG